MSNSFFRGRIHFRLGIAWWMEILAIALVNFTLGLLSLRIDVALGLLAPFWPAAGFDVAILMLRGRSRWPGILLGSLALAYLWVARAGGGLGWGAAAMAVGATGAGRAGMTVLCVWMILRLAGSGWMHQVRGVWIFIAVAGVLYPAAMAGVLTVASAVGGTIWNLPLARNWFAMNSAGVLLVAPLIWSLREPGPFWGRSRSPGEAAVCLALVLGFSVWIFHQPGRFSAGYPPVFVVTVPVMWAAVRFGSRGAVLGVAAVSIVAAAALIQAPLPAFLLLRIVHRVQLYLEFLAVVMLTLAAVVEERRVAFTAVDAIREDLARRVRERTADLSLLQATIESTADGIVVVNRKGQVVSFNRRFAELWRIPDVLLAMGEDAPLLDFTQAQVENPAEFLMRVRYLYEHPDEESSEVLHLCDGRIFERISRPQQIGEEIVGRVWSFRDETRRRRAELERDRLLVEESRSRKAAEQAVVEARAAIRVRDEFLSIASHEMKTPLTSLRIHLQRVEQLAARAAGGPVEPTQLEHLVAVSRRQLDRLQGLINQLLSVMRITTGEMPIQVEPLDLCQLAAEQIRQHSELAARAQSTLSLEAAGPVWGSWDRHMVEQVLGVLLSNALKFGAGQPVTVRLAVQQEHAVLEVVDHGIGIAPEDRERIFDRYERAVSVSHYGGFGLGLWMARRMIHALGGEVSVESAPGKGATFTVRLPRGPAMTDVTQPPPG